jgi:hypothetical protein
MNRTEYQAKLLQIKELRDEVDKPRCGNCDELWEGQCRHHGAIPEDYVYQVNTCALHFPKVPF